MLRGEKDEKAGAGTESTAQMWDDDVTLVDVTRLYSNMSDFYMGLFQCVHRADTPDVSFYVQYICGVGGPGSCYCIQSMT